MKLFDSPYAPNPRRVRVFLAEKQISVPVETVELAKGQHRDAGYTAINPLQRTPALQLGDGTIITESIAICRYFEGLQPDPPLFGVGALDCALVEMWQRRMELSFLMPVAMAYRHSHPAAATLEVPQIAEMALVSRPRALDFLSYLDSELARRPFIAGERFTVADITGLVAIDFLRPARIELPQALTHVRRWHAQVSARPSAKA